jgi:hypothetical protein
MEEFTTTDLGLGSYLLAKRFPLLRITRSGTRRHAFHFPLAAQESADDYLRGGMIEARTFAAALRDLKVRIFEPGMVSAP